MRASYTIRSPQTLCEQQRYYDLRWRILRAPWDQPQGSERDDDDTGAVHAMAVDYKGNVIGVARLHQIAAATAQIRYMAVEKEMRNRGIGKALLDYLEERARQIGIRVIELNARQQCIGFYLKQGYIITGPGPVLFGEIKHQKMQKQFS